MFQYLPHQDQLYHDELRLKAQARHPKAQQEATHMLWFYSLYDRRVTGSVDLKRRADRREKERGSEISAQTPCFYPFMWSIVTSLRTSQSWLQRPHWKQGLKGSQRHIYMRKAICREGDELPFPYCSPAWSQWFELHPHSSECKKTLHLKTQV